MKTKITVGLLLPLLLLSGCRGNREIYLKDIYKDYFTIGAAFNEGYLENTTLDKHYNSLTCENAMKWISVHPNLTTYNFENADKYVTYAKKHKMGIRGHALVWHHEKAISADVFASHDKETVLDIEREHVDTVVKHFKDAVYCWDVCNEVIADGDSELKEDESNIYRQSEWYTICGRDFIKEAFVQADKTLKELGIRDKVKLFYNDYDNTKVAKREKTLAMLNWLISEEVPIDGIGMQCHYHLGSFNPTELEDSIKAYSNLGLDVQITEFDVDVYDETLPNLVSYETYDDVPEDSLRIQATIYDRAFEIFRRNKDKISNVSFWGISDNNTYMNDNPDYGYRVNYPYIFDVFEGKKDSYYLITEFKGGNR